jgi:hypothetical protein
MQYPGRIIKAGETDGAIVRAIRARLNIVLGLTPRAPGRLDERNPAFGESLTQTVKLFQARHVDADGRPLLADGKIGSITWEVLFGTSTVPAVTAAPTPLMARVVSIAGAQATKAVREQPPFSNRGADVEAYQRRAGSHAGLAWCCSFVYWCFDEASRALARRNPMVKTAGCLDHWQRAVGAGATRIVRVKAVANPGMLAPGMLFVMDHGGGLGHTGIIARVNGGLLDTIEGNTDASQSREGGGVYRLTRKIADINLGYIDYAGA